MQNQYLSVDNEALFVQSLKNFEKKHNKNFGFFNEDGSLELERIHNILTHLEMHNTFTPGFAVYNLEIDISITTDDLDGVSWVDELPTQVNDQRMQLTREQLYKGV